MVDIPLNQITKPNLTLKYDRLNLFKEIATGFDHSLQTTSESTASLSDGLI